MDTMTLFDIIITFFGVYITIITLQMKKTGKVHSMLLAKEDLKRCKDQKAFVELISLWSFLFGGVIVVLGGLGLLVDFKIITIPYWSLIEMIIFAIFLVLFMTKYYKAKELYL